MRFTDAFTAGHDIFEDSVSSSPSRSSFKAAAAAEILAIGGGTEDLCSDEATVDTLFLIAGLMPFFDSRLGAGSRVTDDARCLADDNTEFEPAIFDFKDLGCATFAG